jgi:hypothetical protein
LISAASSRRAPREPTLARDGLKLIDHHIDRSRALRNEPVAAASAENRLSLKSQLTVERRRVFLLQARCDKRSKPG